MRLFALARVHLHIKRPLDFIEPCFWQLTTKPSRAWILIGGVSHLKQDVLILGALLACLSDTSKRIYALSGWSWEAFPSFLIHLESLLDAVSWRLVVLKEFLECT